MLTPAAELLLLIARAEQPRIVDLAAGLGISDGHVYRLLAELERCGYLTRLHPGGRGQGNLYEIHRNADVQGLNVTVGEFIRAFELSQD